ncbi:DUF2252 domain-containing protein [Microbacterium sp. W1N]|uniref:DUF2252 domain-containing protein n=1 Tax=Microbacterium festucae TaxID=2977531 RepID=UPI0021C0AE10|nr:DUF2252 domain-containing protein [Microbacterium festucae]MCT9820659.1 DUF2252 domain-containing protein [Microbacterium festucae]
MGEGRTASHAAASGPRASRDEGMSSFARRRAAGRDARAQLPRSAHADAPPAAGRHDPVALLEEQAATRVPDLVPVRHARMSVSPFTFYRGAALLMAADLARLPHSGITVQLCGDAHLTNFGMFGTPERRLVFDINDFDETLPGPFEWDVKRLAASFAVAGRHRGFSEDETRAAVTASVRGYREAMRAAAAATVLDAWYDHRDAGQVRRWLRDERRAGRAGSRELDRLDAAIAKARSRDRMKAFGKLVRLVDGRLRIVADPPLLVPVEDLTGGADETELMRRLLDEYRVTLPHLRHPLSEYTYRHMAHKVVGVGSVGTRAWVILLSGRDDRDPLLLQAKQAQASVLERFLGPSEYPSHGERVVRGQRLMQTASDIFLGWQQVTSFDGVKRDFYVRQLHDWKGGLDPEVMTPRGAALYAKICGETLARAHARSGDRVQIAGYLGAGTVFDDAVTAFAEAYADQNAQDYRAFTDAIASGRLAVSERA